ncbi:TetR/AcrR family transcriptional regulator [Mesorhizobium sp. INR15]|uniref:TetR/AcrR family transcriptional regulator n=1 Tax=Mesorhizobium sp. INR15 TaxID=2654248 RepID=UPI0018964BE4|nr:TetR/AcrR family transcriptional regulator [Mesorhizobium sp. INR15]QPC90517.1 TetR family transcriptional regulator [Mesorhizobium sp. INR15]
MDTYPERTLEIVAEGSTPDLILAAAGRLFTAKGFHGTSTREIALAVGIRQPSLFHHFPSKTAIAQYLLEYDRLRSPFLMGRMELEGERPAVRIYQSLRGEAVVITTSRYELQGLYLTEVLQEPDFVFWKTEYDRALASVRALMITGVESGDFIEHDAALATQLFDAMLTRVIRWNKNREHDAAPDAIATLLLRAVLRNPDTVAEIRQAADRALAKL